MKTKGFLPNMFQAMGWQDLKPCLKNGKIDLEEYIEEKDAVGGAVVVGKVEEKWHKVAN